MIHRNEDIERRIFFLLSSKSNWLGTKAFAYLSSLLNMLCRRLLFFSLSLSLTKYVMKMICAFLSINGKHTQRTPTTTTTTTDRSLIIILLFTYLNFSRSIQVHSFERNEMWLSSETKASLLVDNCIYMIHMSIVQTNDQWEEDVERTRHLFIFLRNPIFRRSLIINEKQTKQKLEEEEEEELRSSTSIDKSLSNVEIFARKWSNRMECLCIFWFSQAHTGY